MPRRVATELDDDLYKRINDLVPWGARAEMIRVVFELIADAIEKEGSPMLGAILSGELALTVRKKDEQTGRSVS